MMQTALLSSTPPIPHLHRRLGVPPPEHSKMNRLWRSCRDKETGTPDQPPPHLLPSAHHSEISAPLMRSVQTPQVVRVFRDLHPHLLVALGYVRLLA